VAALPVQQERIREWQALNGLRPERPMAMIDEIPWHELAAPGVIAADELVMRTTHPFARELEMRFLRELYRWNHVRVDMVVEPVVDVAKVINRPGWGLKVAESTIDQGGVVQSHHYSDQLAQPEDVEKIRVLEPSLNVEATAEREAWAQECLDGILDVRMQGLSGWTGDDLTFALWDDIETFRGTEPILLDFMDRPEHLHAIAERLTEVRIAEMKILEEKGLLGYGMQRIHCTGAHTTELPREGFEPARPRAVDTWTVGRSQLFVSVGDATFDEFVPQYYARWYGHFGLGYFGCCDPLHNRIDSVRTIPNVRKISVSAWAKVQKAAESIGPDYVYSRKPNPAMVAMDAWVPAIAEKDFTAVLEATRANGCPTEFTLKDISTCRTDPQRLWDWCSIAERMVRA
ncbi:MAG TPA: hypothetical protein VLQ79_07050, partial [Myxococcaceae bacterium]|nr:hypothetical protein [Myxococcaceae bacterium]